MSNISDCSAELAHVRSPTVLPAAAQDILTTYILATGDSSCCQDHVSNHFQLSLRMKHSNVHEYHASRAKLLATRASLKWSAMSCGSQIRLRSVALEIFLGNSHSTNISVARTRTEFICIMGHTIAQYIPTA